MRKKTKIYSVYLKKDSANPLETAIFLEDGFNLYAFFFGALWALYHRVWILFLVLLLFGGTIEYLLMSELPGMNEATYMALQFAIAIWVGYEANDWRGAALEKKAYVLYEIIAAHSLLDAQRRFFDRYDNNSNKQAIVPVNNGNNFASPWQ